MKNRIEITGWNWGKILTDILKTFIGVLLAFWVGEWTANRDFRVKERYLLEEIQHELELNLIDLKQNLLGHEKGVQATMSMRRYLQDESLPLDSLPIHFTHLLRDFITIQHTAAFETMKARGVESIKNDSLRLHIADLYDFDFESIEKIEEDYSPHEFFTHYHQPMLQILSKCYDFSKLDGKDNRIMPLTALPKQEQNLMNAWLWKLKLDRQFSIENYKAVILKVEKVIADIQQETGVVTGG